MPLLGHVSRRGAVPQRCASCRLLTSPFLANARLSETLHLLASPLRRSSSVFNAIPLRLAFGQCISPPKRCVSTHIHRGVLQRSAEHIRGRLCFSWAVRCFSVAERCLRHGAVRCPRLPCHAMPCLCRANSCCAQQSLCFAIIAINASPSLRGEMPYLCVANPATLSLCLQCFSLTARYIAILSLLHVLLYLTQQVHSLAFQCHALTGYAFPWRRLSARAIACAG